MYQKPDTIKISAALREDIHATHADLHVAVKGSSLFSGEEAMKKAREVNQLVEALTGFGVKSEAISLQGVRIESASGALLKSSSAMYRLKIRCEDLNQFAGMLDVIAAQKNATVERIEWKYNEEEAHKRLLKSVIEMAKTKAMEIASLLGVKLLGVYDFIENTYDEEAPIPFQAQALPMKRAMPSAAEPNLGMEIQHNKTIHVNVDVWYRVSEFQG